MKPISRKSSYILDTMPDVSHEDHALIVKIADRAADPKQREIWTYLGQRLASDKKTSHVWRDQEGIERWFGKLKGTSVGGNYAVDVEHRPDGSVFVAQAVTYQGQAEDAQALVLEARGAMQVIERRRLEKNAAKKDALDEAIQPLLELAAKTKTHAGTAALVEYVTRRIYLNGR